MYIARQPILDRGRAIAGYELLYRTGGAPITDGTFATASVVAKAFADPEYCDVLGPHRGFINVDANFLAGELIELLPPERVVIELLEDIEFTPALVERCRELRAKGYMLASDDYRGDLSTIAPVLNMLDIVKVDLPQLNGRDLAEIGRDLAGKTLLAEKVETREEYERFSRAGYSLFQGYYFAKPEQVGKSGQNPVRGAAVRVLALLAQDKDDAEIADAIKQYPDLVVGLLRLVNAAASGLSTPIASVRQALIHLGRRPVVLWLQLLVYLGTAGGDPGNHPLLQLAAVRAKTMQVLGERLGRTGERAFLAGLVSLFHVACGVSMEELVGRLSLDSETSEALIGRKGDIGALLSLAEAMERGDDPAVGRSLAALPGLSAGDLSAAAQTAQRWAGSLGGRA